MKGRALPLSLAALALAALAIRLAFRIDHDEDIDALRFRLGVERFDVTELRPHAPFYPVYIASAKLLVGLGASPHLALAWVSAGAGAALTVFTALLAFELLGRRAAIIAGGLALGSPFLWLVAEKLQSDIAGAAGITLSLWLLARARRNPAQASALRTAAIVIFGVGLGIRLSYFPFAMAAVALVARAEGGGRAYLARARDLAAGVMLWLVPLVVIAGPKPLVAVTQVQMVGHFTRWGGTALTVSSPSERLAGAVWGLWANLLGGAWPDAPWSRWIGAPILALFLLLGARRAIAARARIPPEIAIGAAAYLVWAALGQNTVDKPRHWLPLGSLAIVVIAAGCLSLTPHPPLPHAGEGPGVREHRPRLALAAAAAVLGVQWFIDGASLAAAHRALSPSAALVAFAAEQSGRDLRPILTRDLGRLLQEGAPGRQTTTVRSDQELVERALTSGPEGVLITSEALSATALQALANRGFTLSPAFARPRSRYVDALWNELSLVAAQMPHN